MVVAVYFILSAGGVDAPDGVTAVGTSSLPLFILLGVVLIIVSSFVPKEPRKWLPGALKGIAVLIIIIAFALSGFGERIAREIHRGEDCAANNDCGPRADDIPTINGGTVNIGAGETKTFYVVGTVTVTNNNICYYLDIAPRNAFAVQSYAGGRRNNITPLSGTTELAVVSSRRDPNC